MSVDSEWMVESRLEVPNDALHFPGQCAAVGIAQYDSLCAAADRRVQSVILPLADGLTLARKL